MRWIIALTALNTLLWGTPFVAVLVLGDEGDTGVWAGFAIGWIVVQMLILVLGAILSKFGKGK